MSNLKALRTRIKSIKSTQKITKAMKMVAAAKLRRAKDSVEEFRPYAENMYDMTSVIALRQRGEVDAPALLKGTGNSKTHLLLVISSNRGLCGALNSSVVKRVKNDITELQSQGKDIKVITIGQKAKDQLSSIYPDMIVKSFIQDFRGSAPYSYSREIRDYILGMFNDKDFDICSVYFNRFHSALSQTVTRRQIIPTPEPTGEVKNPEIMFSFEPQGEELLKHVLEHNLSTQIHNIILENGASEQGARMTSMDNATRNAGEMINKVTLQLNRSRQSIITNELIEIIAGAEAI